MRRDLKKSLQLATHMFMAGHAHMTRLESDQHFSVFWLAQYTAYKLSRLALAAYCGCNLQLGSLVLTLQYVQWCSHYNNYVHFKKVSILPFYLCLCYRDGLPWT